MSHSHIPFSPLNVTEDVPSHYGVEGGEEEFISMSETKTLLARMFDLMRKAERSPKEPTPNLPRILTLERVYE